VTAFSGFQEDNFAYDSLQHILSLLSSLDANSFTLLTSLSLSNRSRVKDLWIFTGPATDTSDSTAVEDHDLPYPEPPRLNAASNNGTPSSQHRTLASETAAPAQPATSHHSRSATEDLTLRSKNNGRTSPAGGTLQQSHLLRKPAPRAQVPVSVIQESDTDPYEELGYDVERRANIPSVVSTSTPNMTGVGALGQEGFSFGSLNSPSYRDPNSSPFPPPLSPPQSPNGRRFERSGYERSQTPPPLSSTSPPSSPVRQRSKSTSKPEASFKPHSTLLSPGMFRDSVTSSQTDMSHDIPIKWTGPTKEGSSQPSRLRSGSVTTPKFPGAWQSTPDDENDNEAPYFSKGKSESKTPIYDNMSRVESPEVVQPNVALRQSEAVVFGMIAATSPIPPTPLSPPPSSPRSPHTFQPDRVPSKSSDRSKTSKREGREGGQGWVLVNVEGPASGHMQGEFTGLHPSTSREPSSPLPFANGSTPNLTPSRTPLPPQPSPTAKAIVAIDAVDSKHKKNRSTSAAKDKEGEGTPSGVRRFFSLNRKNSVRELT